MRKFRFDKDNSIKLDYEVDIQIFYIMSHMMIHDGHDFYNDKSKEAFKNYF